MPFCQKCGKKLKEDYSFCDVCGLKLETETKVKVESQKAIKPSESKPKKEPWLSALLNFFFYGLGYVYNGGKRIYFGIGLTILVVAMLYDTIQQPDPSPWHWLHALIFSILFAYDAYKEAKEINEA